MPCVGSGSVPVVQDPSAKNHDKLFSAPQALLSLIVRVQRSIPIVTVVAMIVVTISKYCLII